VCTQHVYIPYILHLVLRVIDMVRERVHSTRVHPIHTAPSAACNGQLSCRQKKATNIRLINAAPKPEEIRETGVVSALKESFGFIK
jgi:hypothetical protein